MNLHALVGSLFIDHVGASIEKIHIESEKARDKIACAEHSCCSQRLLILLS